MTTPRDLLVPALFLLMLAGYAREAQAQPPEAPRHTALWTEHRWALEGQIAPLMNSPVGIAGINLDYTLDPSVSLTAGVGVSLTSRSPQFSLMGRPRIFVGNLAFFGGIGLSAGRYVPVLQGLFQEGYYTEHAVNPALWLNTELGIENRHRDGISYRLSVGVSRLINSGSWECRSIKKGNPSGSWRSCSGSDFDGFPNSVMPYVSLAVGYFR